MSDLAVVIVAMTAFAAWVLTIAYWAQVQAIKAAYKQHEERDQKEQAQ